MIYDIKFIFKHRKVRMNVVQYEVQIDQLFIAWGAQYCYPSLGVND